MLEPMDSSVLGYFSWLPEALVWSLLPMTLAGVCTRVELSSLKTASTLCLAQRGNTQMEEMTPPTRFLGTPVSAAGTSGVIGGMPTSVGRLEGPGSGSFPLLGFSPSSESCWRALSGSSSLIVL